MLLLDKRKFKFSYIQDVFYLMLKYGFKKKKITIINDFVDFFIIGYEWEEKVKFEIVDNLDELISREDVAFYKEYFIRLGEKNADVYGRKPLIERIFRKVWFRKQERKFSEMDKG